MKKMKPERSKKMTIPSKSKLLKRKKKINLSRLLTLLSKSR